MSWGRDAKNAAWLLADKLLRFVGGTVIGIIVARYLGPERFGQLNFAQAWVGMFSGIGWLGVGDSVIRDLVQRPEAERRIIATSWRLRLAGSLLSLALALIFFLALGHSSAEGLAMVLVLGLSVVLLEPASVSVLWFQAHRRLKPAGVARTAGYSVHQGLRLLAVAAGLGVVAIAAGALVESAITCALLLYAYRKSSGPNLGGSWDREEAVRIFRQGVPIMIGGLLGTLFLRIDQVILGQLAGNRELGIYSAAVRISEVWWVFPALVMQATAPRIFYARALDEAELQRRLTLTSCVLFYAALSAASLTTIFADRLVPLLLGTQYQASTPVLVIHTWIAVFVFLDAAAYQYLIARNLQRFIMLRSGVALTINAVAAALLAPRYGAPGVAVGALIAYFFGTVITYLFSTHTRAIALCQIRGLASLPTVFGRLARSGA
jgi:PST family polysaccharide transporter